MAVAVLGGALTKAPASMPSVQRSWRAGLSATSRADRSSRPDNSPLQRDAVLNDRIAALRRKRSPSSTAPLETGVSPATLSRVLKPVGHRITGDRTGQSNLCDIGWEYVHVCIDDASRIAFTDILPDEKMDGLEEQRVSDD